MSAARRDLPPTGVRRDWPWLAGIVLLGLILRTVAIGRETLWGDEATTLALGRLSAVDLFLRPVESNPGLYFWLHGHLIPLSAGLAGQRMLALAAGLLTIPATYALGRARRGPRVGLAAALLAAADFMLVDFSQEARPYSVLVLLTTVSAAALITALRRIAEHQPTGRFLALFAMAGAAACETHLVGWFWYGPAMLVALVRLWRSAPRPWPTMAALGAFFLLQFAIEGHRAVLFSLAPVNSFQWLKQASVGHALAMIGELVLPLRLWKWAKHALTLPGAAVLFGLLAVAAIVWWRRSRLAGARVRADWTFAPLAILLLIPLELWLVGEVATPMAMSRTFLPAAPALLVLIAALVERRGGRAAIAVLALVLTLDTAAAGFSRKKERWDVVVERIAAYRRAGEGIAICPSWRSTSLTYQLSLSGPLPRIVGMSGDIMVDLSPPPGANWAEQYNHVWKIPTAPAYIATAPRQPEASRPHGPMLVLIGDCHEEERARIADWIGSARWTELARVPDGKKRTMILYRADPAS